MVKRIIFFLFLILFLFIAVAQAQIPINKIKPKEGGPSGNPLYLNKVNELKVGLPSFSKEDYNDIDVITLTISTNLYNPDKKQYESTIDMNKIEFDSVIFEVRGKFISIPLIKKEDYIFSKRQDRIDEYYSINHYDFYLLKKDKLNENGYLIFKFKNVYPFKKNPIKVEIELWKDWYKEKRENNECEEIFCKRNELLYSDFLTLPVFEESPSPQENSPIPKENFWTKNLKLVKIPVSEDATVVENQPNQGFPFALGANPYTASTAKEQMILLQFPLKDKEGNWYVPKSAYIYQVAIHLYEVAGYSPGKKSIHIQFFHLGDLSNHSFDQTKVNWNNMPKLGSPFFTAEIPITVGPLSLFDIKEGFKTFHLINEYQYASFAIRVPAFDKGYVQFADKDSLYQDQTAAELLIWYSDYPLPTPTLSKTPPEKPYDIHSYYDRLTRWVIVSWKTNSKANKVQVERRWDNVNRYFAFSGEINTYNDSDVFNSYFVSHPQNPVTYGIRTCNDTSFDNNCVYASQIVYSQPVFCLDCLGLTPFPSANPISPTNQSNTSEKLVSITPISISPQDKNYQEKIKEFEEKIRNQEKEIRTLKKEVQKQKNLLEKILSFLTNIFNFLNDFKNRDNL